MGHPGIGPAAVLAVTFSPVYDAGVTNFRATNISSDPESNNTVTSWEFKVPLQVLTWAQGIVLVSPPAELGFSGVVTTAKALTTLSGSTTIALALAEGCGLT